VIGKGTTGEPGEPGLPGGVEIINHKPVLTPGENGGNGGPGSDGDPGGVIRIHYSEASVPPSASAPGGDGGPGRPGGLEEAASRLAGRERRVLTARRVRPASSRSSKWIHPKSRGYRGLKPQCTHRSRFLETIVNRPG
jgi:hypothetical protein